MDLKKNDFKISPEAQFILEIPDQLIGASA